MDSHPLAGNGHLTARPGSPYAQVGYQPSLRVALYSHDTMGLGHIRRNLLLAQALQQGARSVDVLLVAGALEARSFVSAQGIDCLTLPALSKAGNGRYQSRRLDLSFEDLISLRSGVIRAALNAFDPDVLIVDKVPRGVGGELDPTLEDLAHRGKVRCVLGLRDILDDPETVRLEWAQAANFEAIRRFYDAVWVYGDPAVYDVAEAYGFPSDVAAKLRYTGYLDQRPRLALTPEVACDNPSGPLGADGPFALCLVGGGQDGSRVALAFAQVGFPDRMRGVILTGPFLPAVTRKRLEQFAARRRDLQVIGFVPEPGHLIHRADRVVAMGGYNSVAEVLSYEKQALIVPRVSPRLEQYIRARRLSELGLIDMLHPEQLSPTALGAWLARPGVASPAVHSRIDLGGTARLAPLLEDLLSGSAPYVLSMDHLEELSHGVA